ncbi:winged helix-turn-helix transcriptional regulator [Companilactobacillus kimchiensis]|uniref:HTH hxlR-type domain-containing protein n=1 Tax=Companilactobacillus kimchiensis TaxID=993692 RepID=A0A0R2LIH0_9LACO|nr:helix-turn-helix domain-containing protein [Companilactobacillus kimchiensis]KRN99669.1 hypothetical protein IV57_GL002484 [Companilactobacillus kimchiensis]
MKEYNIGIEASLDVISGKWKPLILCYIGIGINRNGELLRKIPHISQKVLTEQLKQLINDDILKRTVINEKPLHVEYSFTDYGESLRKILLSLCHWGEIHIDHMNQANDYGVVDVSLFK